MLKAEPLTVHIWMTGGWFLTFFLCLYGPDGRMDIICLMMMMMTAMIRSLIVIWCPQSESV